ncbi:MAG: MerR family transcriptional regulator, partial [Thermoplasmata archaeon]|nr:MerR family transcriptional regulator [Thermoplasmata archaeon]
VQEGLLQPPLGVGRGRHYGAEHLKRLLEVKALQEQGRSLSEIREAIESGPRVKGRLAEPPQRAQFVRLEVLPGVELNVSSAYRVPSPGRLAELAEWCRTHLRRLDEEER